MKKKLKQTAFFARLKYHKLTLATYSIMYKLYNREEVKEDHINKIPTTYLNGKTLSEKGIKIIESIDDLFQPLKKQKTDELMGIDYEQKIQQYIELFPTERLPNGKYARGNKKNIETNFRWFFENYDYSWDTIFGATQLYINEFRANNYLYMRTALYFIKKQDDGKSILSDMADYCDRYMNSGDYIEQKHFKTQILS